MILILEKLFSQERETPQVETAPILTPTITPPAMEVDTSHYAKAAKIAQQLAIENQQFLESVQTKDNTMNPIIASPKTSLAGIVAAAPLFIIGVGALIAGDIGSGVGNIIAALGVLFGLLQAQDASKVSDVVKQIIPKPQATITSNGNGGVFNITPQAPTE